MPGFLFYFFIYNTQATTSSVGFSISTTTTTS